MTPQESSAEQTNAKENNSNSSELLGRMSIENTPFEIVGNKEMGYFAALGKFRITVPYQTPEEVQRFIDNNTYTVMLTILQILIPAEIKHELETRQEAVQGAINRFQSNNKKTKTK